MFSSLSLSKSDAQKVNEICDHLDDVTNNIIESVSEKWGEASEILRRYGIVAKDREEVIEKLPSLIAKICSRRIANEDTAIEFLVNLYGKRVLNTTHKRSRTSAVGMSRQSKSDILAGVAALYSGPSTGSDKHRLGFIHDTLVHHGTRFQHALKALLNDILNDKSHTRGQNLKRVAQETHRNCQNLRSEKCAYSLLKLFEAIDKSEYVNHRAQYALDVLQSIYRKDLS